MEAATAKRGELLYVFSKVFKKIRGECYKMEYEIGDIVKTKKQHPCGSKLWELTRVGVDFKLKCLGCEHVIVLEREKALKIITKKIEK